MRMAPDDSTGHKKGAHYSAQMRLLRILRIGLTRAILFGALAAVPVAAAALQRSHVDATEARAQLEALRHQIARIARQVSQGQAERDRLTRQLRATEESVGKARAALDALARRRAATAAQRAQLEARKARREADLARQRKALAGQLRAAYLIGRQEPLKLLLNQGDPARAGRMFVYYSYFSRARAQQIHAVEADLRQIGELDAQLQAQDATLAGLQQAQQSQVSTLKQARAHRLQVLASISARTRTRAARLALLKRQQQDLETLLARLRRAAASLPQAQLGNYPFARLRGRLLRPVAGRVIASYGQVRAGGLKWQGDLFATARDAPVHAVSQGRVIYADWLAGLGLLIIIDHGDGFMSLYGHNARLYESVGQRVAAGQTIAQAGDSGGGSRPELYFEIRKDGKPLNPQIWLRH
jgi:septal ring factor EnvC (AmiA/AmiB activator)